MPSLIRGPQPLRTILLLGTLLLPASVSAHPGVAPHETGTGGGPHTTITAPYTNSLGVTKPPGTSLGPGEVPSAKAEHRERALTDRIVDSICTGCQ